MGVADDVSKEMKAIRKISRALEEVPESSRERVLIYLNEHLQMAAASNGNPTETQG